MKYYIYKFCFNTAVHIGNGNLTDGESTICADTLFSGLCHEAVKNGGQQQIDELVNFAKSGKLQFSDMLPFIADDMYIPKPLCPVKVELEGDSVQKKKFKKLKYIPIDKISVYMSGNLNAEEETDKIKQLGMFEMRNMASSLDPEKSQNGEMMPYSVGVFKFAQNSGLYIIAGFEDDSVKVMFDMLLTALSYSGLGGKRSAGFGRYTFTFFDAPQSVTDKLIGKSNMKICISTAMAKPEELEKTLENARYILAKRSGFVLSQNYADSLMRKKDFYAFKAGSCFENTFDGDVFDVSDGGSHPVYRYAKPMFMEV